MPVARLRKHFSHPRRLIKMMALPSIALDWWRFRRLDRARRFGMRIRDAYPCLRQRTPTTGFDRHYIYHVAWAARWIAQLRPASHVDISSSLYFAVTVSAFCPIRFYDYRPADLELSNFDSGSADLLNLPFPDDSLESLSCMHVIEHVGLGRYGDPIQPDADLLAARELARVLAPGGYLLFVTPVGAEPRIEFNAHRIYDRASILGLFPGLVTQEFALIPMDSSDGGIVVDPSDAQLANERYGCACVLLRKPPNKGEGVNQR